ncbi:response regulator, partial [Streptomyces sp. AcH 505]|uniref:response regulator n=1 Tax=Streptomyces sp. AcH 505 TaxID=352211 RepID=UPI001F516A3B
RPGWPDPDPGDGDNGPDTSGPQSSVGPPTADSSAPHPPRAAHQPLPPAQPLPEEAPAADSAQGRAYSVRTLGQGVPFVQQIAKKQAQAQSQHQTQGQQVQSLHQAQAQAQQAQAQAQQQAPSRQSHQTQGQHVQGQQIQGQHAPAQHPAQDHSLGGQGQSGQSGTLGSGRRRKLGSRADGESAEPDARSHPQPPDQPAQGNGSRLAGGRPEGRSYAIGAPDEGAEGPEPLDGPGGAVEVANRPQPQPVDDELPPEPLDNPRRLLVWPAPDVSTSQALSDRGYRPVVVHSREEVAAQIAAFPAALFVDPLTGPITRTALQSLRQAAVAAEVPVLVTAGLGQATREAAYGADPAVLLKALAPRDSEQHPPRVLLIEEHEEIAIALTATLERRGMQVARAADDNEAVALAAQMRPNLVVMDLMQVRRQRAGIIDWLRSNGQLNRTPLVVYTSAGIDPAELPRLTSGETVLFLAERSTSVDVQSRIVELLAKIGTN